MQTHDHQLKKKPFYFPDWEVEHLFLGTFNPQGGEKVKYYYGRQKNQTWKLISKVFCSGFDPNSQTFFDLLKEYKIACVDMIDKIIASESKFDKLVGRGYKDSAIINTSVQREYNTSKIQKLIKENSNIKVYSTWGKGSNLKEWKKEVEKLGEIIFLVSPSMAARVPKGEIKFDYMLADWQKKINQRD
jgi:G:T/U-mismatch repair DNA glycosylase